MWEYKYTPGKKEHEFNIISAEIISKHCEGLGLSLEIGAGTGQLSFLLKGLNSGLYPFMIDSSLSSIAYIIEYFRHNAIKHFTVSYPDYFYSDPRFDFDLVFSSGLIEHFKDGELKSICDKHKKFSNKYIACIVPYATEENMAITQTEKHKKLYGYEKPMTEKELDNLFVDDTFKKVHGQTFYKNNKLLIGVYKK